MAHVDLRVYEEDGATDVHGHHLPLGMEVFIRYWDGNIGTGRTQWNTPPVPGCICPWDDQDPNCPVPFEPEDDY